MRVVEINNLVPLASADTCCLCGCGCVCVCSGYSDLRLSLSAEFTTAAIKFLFGICAQLQRAQDVYPTDGGSSPTSSTSSITSGESRVGESKMTVYFEQIGGVVGWRLRLTVADHLNSSIFVCLCYGLGRSCWKPLLFSTAAKWSAKQPLSF